LHQGPEVQHYSTGEEHEFKISSKFVKLHF
jgi:hypothetical protein